MIEALAVWLLVAAIVAPIVGALIYAGGSGREDE